MGTSRLTTTLEDVNNTPQGDVMYLGTTDQALEIARGRRQDEIANATKYHRSRLARKRTPQRSTVLSRITQPVRRSD
jgi:hypothetical protein